MKNNTTWKEIFDIDLREIKSKYIDCDDKKNKSICGWREVALKRIKSGYDFDIYKLNKTNLKKTIKYCEEEIQVLEKEIKLKKKYKNIYHENTWISDSLILEGFEVVKKRLENNL